MIFQLWHDYLFVPLLNFLVILYNTVAFENLGIAVIYLTVLLRLILLPFSLISEMNSYRYAIALEKIKNLDADFHNDPVAKRERIKEILAEQKINPWASAFLLGFQFLFLILLYQVFIGGMNPEKLNLIYPSIYRPDFIDTKFLGFDLSVPDLFLSALVGVVLYLQIVREQKKKQIILERGDILFRYLFPFSVFLLLYRLPSVKTIFILTSMACSRIIHFFQPLLVKKIKQIKK